MTKSHTRRFIQSAWALLSFQLIASVGAVAVTGAAALHVSRLAAQVEATQTPGAVEEASVDPMDPADTAPDAPTVTPSDTPIGTPTEPAPAEPTPGDATPTPETPTRVVACERVMLDQRPTLSRARIAPVVFRVPANAEWCDTGVGVRQGQTLTLRAQGRWNHQGAPEYGPAGAGQRERNTYYPRAAIGALIGRVGARSFPIGDTAEIATADDGTLQLSMNDSRGRFADNQGYVDVAIQVADPQPVQ